MKAPACRQGPAAQPSRNQGIGFIRKPVLLKDLVQDRDFLRIPFTGGDLKFDQGITLIEFFLVMVMNIAVKFHWRIPLGHFWTCCSGCVFSRLTYQKYKENIFDIG